MVDKATMESLAISLSHLANLSGLIREEHAKQANIDPTFDRIRENHNNDHICLAVSHRCNGRIIEVRLDGRMPYYAEAIRIMQLLMKHAQSYNIKIMEEQLLDLSGQLAPLLGLARVSLSELELPKGIVLPRAIDPLNIEEESTS